MQSQPSTSPSLANFVAVQGYFPDGQLYVTDNRSINRLSKI
jgi:hypothetical protein